MNNDFVLGPLYYRGKVHDGKHDESDDNLFSIVGFLSPTYRKLFLKHAKTEKHLLDNIEEALDDENTTFISDYINVNKETIGKILKRTKAKRRRMHEKHLDSHIGTITHRVNYLSRLKEEGKEIIELIGGGSVVEMEYSNLVIRKIANFLVTPSYRIMEFGTKGFMDRTELAYQLNGVPPDIITFRTANPWIIRMVPRFKNAGYNYVLAGESPRADGNGTVVQYMLFSQMKDNFDSLLVDAEERYPTASSVLKPFSDTAMDFMDNGIEKVSIRQLKDQYALLEAFPEPEQFESGEKADYDYVRQYIQQMEHTYTPEHKVSYRAASIALNNKEQYGFLPELFKKLIGTLDSFKCHDLEEFMMSYKGLPLQKEIYKLAATA